MVDSVGVEALVAYAGQISEAAVRTAAASLKQHDYIHGDDQSDVGTESGSVPSIAKQARLSAERTAVLEQLLADPADPGNGAGLLGRSTVAVASIAHLLSAKRDSTQAVQVSSFYNGVYALASPTEGDSGQGFFKWAPSVPRSLHNGGTVISPTVPWDGTQAGLTNFLRKIGETAPSAYGCWVRMFTGETSVKWFGAKGDGIANDYEACVMAHATARNIKYPVGDYLVRTTFGIQILPGTIVTGEGSARFSGVFGKTKTRIRNDQVGGGIFWYTNDSTIVQRDSLRIFDIELVADNAIRLNPLDGVIADGAASNIPYLMKFAMDNVSLSPYTVGTGIGCALTKVFDGSITHCEFRSFGTQLLLQGCDLTVVNNNRFTLVYDFAILELSASTFGSQNVISENDIVTSMSGNAVYIKTSSRHVRVMDNYLEQGGAGFGSLKGYIDISGTGAPVYGNNSPSTTRLSSVIVERNRIDGHAKATGFIYRYEPVGVQVKIHDVGTSGSTASINWLTVEGDELPLFRNTDNACIYDFYGGTQKNSKWGSFRNEQLSEAFGGVSFNVKSLLDLNLSELQRDNSYQHVRLTPRGFLIKPSMSTVLNLILPTVSGINNIWLATGTTYNVTVVARAKSSSATLRLVRLVNLQVQSPTLADTVLTTQGKAIKFTMVGAGAGADVGLGIRTIGSSDDIEVQSISFVAV